MLNYHILLMSIEAPNILGNFDKETYFRTISRLTERLNLQGHLTNANLVADLGSGLGNSTAALRKLCPEAEVHSVDMVFSRLHESNLDLIGERHQHYSESIHGYLNRLVKEGRKLDVVLLAAVPEHQLDQWTGYVLLSRQLLAGGLVIEMGDTKLGKKAMQEHFDVLHTEDNPYYGISFWQKRPEN